MRKLLTGLIKKYFLALLSIGVVFVIILGLILIFEINANQGSIHTFFESIWYGFVTIAGVGYGDFTPVTLTGRVLGIVLLVGSIVLTAVFTSQLTNEIRKIMEDKKMGLHGTKMKDHFVIIGWDNFASNVAEWVGDAGKEIAVITNNPADIEIIYNKFGNKKVFVLFSDYDKPERFELCNIKDSASVFINFHEDSDTLVHLLNIKKKYPSLNYVASLNKAELRDTFHAAGITFSVSNNEVASKLVASYIFEPDVANFTEDIMASAQSEDDYDMVEYEILEKNPYKGKDYFEVFLSIKEKYNCVLLGISREVNGQFSIIKNPRKGEKILLGDYIIMLADGSAKLEIGKLFDIKEGRCIKKQKLRG